MLDTPHFWLILVALVATASSIRGIIDNYVADVVFRKIRPEAVRIAGIFSFGLLLIFLLAFAPPYSTPVLVALGLMSAGILDAVGGMPYSHALKYAETTGITVLKQIHPIIALILGYFVLGDEVGGPQLIAFLLILSAAIVIVKSHGKRQQKIGLKATRLMIAAGAAWALSDIVFISIGRSAELPFLTAFFWWVAGRWLGDVVMMLMFKSWRRRFASAFRNNKTRFLASISISEMLRLFSGILWRQAILIAPTIALAVVTERTSLLILTFALALALSIIWPKFGREKVTKKAVLMHLIAVSLAAGGVFLMQI